MSRLDRKHLRRYKEYSQREILRPGFTRINLPYFMSEEELDFVIDAVQIIADEGWKLLPQYMFNPETGEWRHRHHQVFKDRKWLGHISYSRGEMSYKDPFRLRGQPPQDLQDCLKQARHLFDTVKPSSALPDHRVMFDEESKPFRWFLLPSEAQSYLNGQSPQKTGLDNILPFCPSKFKKLSKILTLESKECEWIQESFQKEQGDDFSINNAHFAVASKFESTGDFQTGMVKTLDKGFRAVCENIPDNSERIKNDLSRDISPSESKVEVSTFSQVHVDTCNKDKDQLTSESQEKDTVKESFSVKSRNFRKSEKAPSSDQSTYNDVLNSTKLQQEEQGNTYSGDIHPNSGDSNNKFNSDPRVVSGTSNNLHKDTVTQGETLGNAGSVETGLDSRQSEVTYNDPPTTVTKDHLNSIVSEMKTSTNTPSSCKTGNCGDVSQSNSEDVLLCKSVSKKKSPSKCVTEKPSKKIRQSKLLWKSPGKKIFNPFIEAVEEYGMFKSGDRVLIGLSGGKDSLSLLHTIRQYQFFAHSKGIEFEFGAVTVDPQTPAYDPSPLKDYLAQLNVPYFFESQDILKTAEGLDECSSICSFCSRMKRGRMYACARREGYNVIALGQHLDDLSESFLMSFFHNGILRTMKAAYTVEEEDLKVIRPFVHVREKLLREFAEKNKLPVIAENCPACFEAPKERHRIKQLLASQEILHPHIYHSMLAAMKPILAISETGLNVHRLIYGLINDGTSDGEIA